MKLNALGRTGLNVSEICLGTMTWGVQNTEADAHAQLDIALEAGVNFIDTAEAYAIPMSPETYGKTERYIGSWLKASGKREQIIIASKIAGGGSQHWIRNGDAPNAGSVAEAVNDSLQRLNTDYIDLYQIHWPSRSHYHFGGSWDFDPFEDHLHADGVKITEHMHEILSALDEAVKQGKIRHVGLSNETAWGTMQWLRLSEQYGLPRMASIQNEYSLLQRHFDMDMAEITRHEQVGLLAFSSLSAGVLTGKYLDGAIPEGSRAAIANDGFWRNNEHASRAVRSYRDVSEKHGLDLAQMAIAFTIARPFMTSVIIGATTLEQLHINLAAADLKLSDDVLRDVAAVYRQQSRPL